VQDDKTGMADVERICDWLCSGPLAAVELAGRLGRIESEGKTAVYVIPSNAAWSRIVISRERDTHDATYVALTPARAGIIDVAALKARFGPSTEPVKIHWDSPTRLHFDADRDGRRPFRCKVIAEVDETGGQAEAASVASIAVQPERR
jgi:hypothetical protein